MCEDNPCVCVCVCVCLRNDRETRCVKPYNHQLINTFRPQIPAHGIGMGSMFPGLNGLKEEKEWWEELLKDLNLILLNTNQNEKGGGVWNNDHFPYRISNVTHQ